MINYRNSSLPRYSLVTDPIHQSVQRKAAIYDRNGFILLDVAELP